MRYETPSLWNAFRVDGKWTDGHRRLSLELILRWLSLKTKWLQKCAIDVFGVRWCWYVFNMIFESVQNHFAIENIFRNMSKIIQRPNLIENVSKNSLVTLLERYGGFFAKIWGLGRLRNWFLKVFGRTWSSFGEVESIPNRPTNTLFFSAEIDKCLLI